MARWVMPATFLWVVGEVEWDGSVVKHGCDPFRRFIGETPPLGPLGRLNFPEAGLWGQVVGGRHRADPGKILGSDETADGHSGPHEP